MEIKRFSQYRRFIDIVNSVTLSKHYLDLDKQLLEESIECMDAINSNWHINNRQNVILELGDYLFYIIASYESILDVPIYESMPFTHRKTDIERIHYLLSQLNSGRKVNIKSIKDIEDIFIEIISGTGIALRLIVDKNVSKVINKYAIAGIDIEKLYNKESSIL